MRQWTHSVHNASAVRLRLGSFCTSPAECTKSAFHLAHKDKPGCEWTAYRAGAKERRAGKCCSSQNMKEREILNEFVICSEGQRAAGQEGRSKDAELGEGKEHLLSVLCTNSSYGEHRKWSHSTGSPWLWDMLCPRRTVHMGWMPTMAGTHHVICGELSNLNSGKRGGVLVVVFSFFFFFF